MIGSAAAFYGLLIPIVALLLLCVFVVPSMMRMGTKPEEAGKAAYCYLAQSIGIMMMAVGGMPALYAILASQALEGMMYTSLLLVFALGGMVFLSHDTMLRRVDPTSRAVPGAIFFYTWKLIGLLAVLFSIGGLLLRMASGGGVDATWWVFYTVLLVFGGLLMWFTQTPRQASSAFRSISVNPMPAAKAKKPSIKKAKRL